MSGHGYGHAVRQSELGRALGQRGADLVLLSNADAEAFSPLSPRATLVPSEIDVGVLQPSSLEVDEAGTLAAFERFAAGWPQRVEWEARRLRWLGAELVIADIAPLGVLAARRAGVRSVVVANFSWDWIYGAWADQQPRARELAERCAEAYRQADLLLELPLSGGLTAFARRERMPLLVRCAEHGRAELRAELGIAEGQTAVFIAFGGFGPPELVAPVDVDPSRMRFFGYTDLGWPPSLYRQLERWRYPHPDLVLAADVVLGKPGYGTVGECSVHGTRMLWLNRSRFPEVEALVRGIVDHVGGCELPASELGGGRLGAAVEEALSIPARQGPLAAGGAEVIAERLLRFAGEAG